MNRPRLVFGVDKWVLLFVGCLALVFMSVLMLHRYGFWLSVFVTSVVVTVLCHVSNLYTRRDPRFFSCRLRALFHAAVYDPGRWEPFRVEVRKKK